MLYTLGVMRLFVKVIVSVVPTTVPVGAVKDVDQVDEPEYTAIPAPEGHVIDPPPAAPHEGAALVVAVNT